MILRRYMANSFIVPFMVALSFFVLFLLTFQLFKIVRIVANKAVMVSTIMELVGHIALSFVPMAIPLSVLFATLYSLNKLSSDSEFVAMRSFGLSRFKLFFPYFFFSLVIGATTFFLNSELIPYSQTQFRKAVSILTSKGLLTDIKKGQFFTDIPEVILFATDVQEEGKVLIRPFIHVNPPNGNEHGVMRTIFAQRGELIKSEENKWGLSDLRLKLFQGNIIKYSTLNDDLEKTLFEEYDFPLTDGGVNVSIATKDSMRSTQDLYRVIKQRDAKRSDKEKISKDDVKAEVEFFGRINTPFMCLIFSLLGFSLGVQKTRGKSRSSSSMTLLVLIAYYALFFFGVSMARKAVIPSYVAVFFPTFIGAIIGVYFYKKLRWVS